MEWSCFTNAIISVNLLHYIINYLLYTPVCKHSYLSKCEFITELYNFHLVICLSIVSKEVNGVRFTIYKRTL